MKAGVLRALQRTLKEIEQEPQDVRRQTKEKGIVRAKRIKCFKERVTIVPNAPDE